MARNNIDWLPQSGTERLVVPVPTSNSHSAMRLSYRTLAAAIIHPLPGIDVEPQHCYVPTRDISKTGVSFLHAKKLEVGQHIELAFQDGKEVEVKVQRFRQIGPRCFLIGCRFTVVPDFSIKK